MTQRFAPHFLLCIGALALWAAPARPDPADLQGAYAIDAAASDNIEAAIERGIADMTFALRPIARSRIVQTNPRYQRITLACNETTVSVQFDARNPITIPLDGSSVPWVREDGGSYDVSVQWSATRLVMYFKAKDGERVNTFVLEPDGTALKLNVRLSSSSLPAPISYALAYRRQER